MVWEGGELVDDQGEGQEQKRETEADQTGKRPKEKQPTQNTKCEDLKWKLEDVAKPTGTV